MSPATPLISAICTDQHRCLGDTDLACRDHRRSRERHQHDSELEHRFLQRNRQVHTGLRPCWSNLRLVERDAVKGEWKDRRLGWINSGLDSYSDPDSFTLGRVLMRKLPPGSSIWLCGAPKVPV